MALLALHASPNCTTLVEKTPRSAFRIFSAMDGAPPEWQQRPCFSQTTNSQIHRAPCCGTVSGLWPVQVRQHSASTLLLLFVITTATINFCYYYYCYYYYQVQGTMPGASQRKDQAIFIPKPQTLNPRPLGFPHHQI